MADQQDFCLRWCSYTQQLSEALKNLLDRELLVDVTLACDGRSLRAHRAVLSACSTYFQELFQESSHPHPIIILKDVRYEELDALVHFMYHGEVTVTHDILPGFLRTAETLHIRGLTDGVLAEHQTKPSKGSSPAEQTLSNREDESAAGDTVSPNQKQIKLEPGGSESFLHHQEMELDGNNEDVDTLNEQREPRCILRADEVASCNADQFNAQLTITSLDGLSQLVMPQNQEEESSPGHFLGVCQSVQGSPQLRPLNNNLGGGGGPSHVQAQSQLLGQMGMSSNGNGRPFRQRVLYNPEQLLQLETWYRHDRYPSGASMREYAETLAAMVPQAPGGIGVQPMRQNVDYWFQNRRRKDFHPEVMQQREKKKLAKALWGSYSNPNGAPNPSSNTNNSNSTDSSSAVRSD